MPTADPHRRFRLTPGHCLLALLAIEFLLFLSQWFRWLPKGWPVLIAVASVGVVVLGMFVWFGVALVLRSRFRFSLRSLLVLVVVVALPCSWFAVEKQQATRERQAITAIEKLGGDAYCCGPSRPRWLVNLVGNDFFNNVYVVILHDSEITDTGLELIKGINQVHAIWLDHTKITDAGLEHLTGMTQLHQLRLNDAEVTDDGVAKLRRALPNCEIER